MADAVRRRWCPALAAGLAAAGVVVLGGGVAPAAAERTEPVKLASTNGFELTVARVSPRKPRFDGPRKIRFRYRFRAAAPTTVRIRLIKLRTGATVGSWWRRRRPPREGLVQVWNGLNRRGAAARSARYEFRIKPRGGRERGAVRFDLRDHSYPIDGPHHDRGPIGSYGAGRNGGRTHEGFDVNADCGTPLVAARGGTVERAGYDPRLYGYFIEIDGRKNRFDYFYAHMSAPARFQKGERVRTGQRVGKVGQTGNAASTPCHLHIELRRRNDLVDPEPYLRRWDRLG